MSATDTDGPTIAERYGRLVVLEYVGYRGDKQLVRCRECGAEPPVRQLVGAPRW